MRIRIELGERDEIVICCREKNESVLALQAAIEEAVQAKDTLTLMSGSTECYVKKEDILYFESAGGRMYAHTADRIYTTPHKLFELEELMPACFVRISRSAIANLKRTAAVRRELVGNGELFFRESEKSVWFSRAYYKLMKYKLDELMGQKEERI